MRLQAYILNEGRSKRVNIEHAKLMLFNECSDAFKAWRRNKEKYIYRGFDASDYYMTIDSKKFPERASANTTNEYTILFNHILKSWTKYPRRNVICSTDDINAASYGYTYFVFPVNGTKIGVCSDQDIWLSFKKGMGGRSLYRVNDFMFEVYGNYYNANDLGGFLHTTYLNHVDGHFIRTFKFMENWKEGESLYDYFNKILNPDKNGFKLVKVGQPLPKDREVWFDGEALLVKYHPKQFMDDLIL